jgi:hypothetical protein
MARFSRTLRWRIQGGSLKDHGDITVLRRHLIYNPPSMLMVPELISSSPAIILSGGGFAAAEVRPAL